MILFQRAVSQNFNQQEYLLEETLLPYNLNTKNGVAKI